MIGILGDIHGDWNSLNRALVEAQAEGAVALIQVGDFGFEWDVVWQMSKVSPQIPVYAIDGNHDNFSILRELPKGEITKLYDNFFYCGRGSSMVLDGRKIVFLGGAGSIDKDIRMRYGMLWQVDEQITEDDLERTIDQKDADIFITHCPPQRIITKHFEGEEGRAMKVQSFGVSPDWSDPSATKLEVAWVELGQPRLICGHMHRSVVDGNVQILNCDELIFV
jgi:Icc-related predicted phosphoesterase